MTRRYISAEEFCDFKENFGVMVNTFNHSISEIKEDVKNIAEKTSKNINVIGKDVAEMRGIMKVSSRLLWALMGIISAITISALLASIDSI